MASADVYHVPDSTDSTTEDTGISFFFPVLPVVFYFLDRQISNERRVAQILESG